MAAVQKQKNHRVLVCDDERFIVRLIQVNLERVGYEVITAYDGAEAIEKIHTHKPDLLLLDVMMPFVDGYEVLKRVRHNPETQNLPVIMLSAKATDSDVYWGYHLGTDLYLTKPFHPAELVSSVDKMLGYECAPTA